MTYVWAKAEQHRAALVALRALGEAVATVARARLVCAELAHAPEGTAGERTRCVRVLETMLREIDAEEDRAWQMHDETHLRDYALRRETLRLALARIEAGGTWL